MKTEETKIAEIAEIGEDEMTKIPGDSQEIPCALFNRRGELGRYAMAV